MALLASRETMMNPPAHKDDYDDDDELSSSCWLDLP